jgi:hypothetical protein
VALEVWIVAPPAAGEPRKALRRRVASLDWDGYYEFLQRFWPASSSTDVAIDLYETTHFAGATLGELRASLLRARMALQERPASWRERIGRQTHPVQKELYAPVDREKLDALIGSLLDAVAVAEERRGRVIFEGD